MRLFRTCCEEEITAIKNNDPVKLLFGGALYNYIRSTSFFENDYKNLNLMWEKYQTARKSNTDGLKFILKVFKHIPNNIPLLEKNLTKKKEIFKFYNKNYADEILPYEIEKLLSDEKFDCVFLSSIKMAGFFSNPNYYYENYNSSNSKVLAIDFPQKVALQFKGVGQYNEGRRVEYALPMYMLESDHVLDSYDRFSITDENFRNDFLKDSQMKNNTLSKKNHGGGEKS